MSDTKGANKRKKTFLNQLLSSINFLVTEDTNTRDQRNSARLNHACKVGFVDENGVKSEGLLVDISRSGLQLKSEQKLRKGITVALNAPEDDTLDRTAPFMAKVRWCRKDPDGGYRAGLALPEGIEEDPHWLEALLHQLGYSDDGSQRRAHIRAKSEVSGQLELKEGGESFDVDILNLGMGGALIKSTTAFDKDSQFYLTIGPHKDLPELKLLGTILRVIEKSDEGFVLHPSRFRAESEKQAEILQEYILKFSDR